MVYEPGEFKGVEYRLMKPIDFDPHQIFTEHVFNRLKAIDGNVKFTTLKGVKHGVHGTVGDCPVFRPERQPRKGGSDRKHGTVKLGKTSKADS